MKVVHLSDLLAEKSNHDDYGILKVFRIWKPSDVTPMEEGRMPFVNWATLSPGEAFSPHHHGDKLQIEDSSVGMSEFFVIIDGRGIFTGGDASVTVTTGDLIYIPRGEVHSLKNLSMEDPLIYICWGVSTGGGTFVLPHE